MNNIKRFDITYYIRKSLCGLEEYRNDNFPNYIFYKKNNEILFEYNSLKNYFWCSYSNFWCNLDNKLHLSPVEIVSLVKCELKTHLNIKNPTIIVGDVYNKRFYK